MSSSVVLNPELLEIIRDNRLPMDDTVGILILIHHNVKPSYLPQELISRIYATGIVRFDPVSKTHDWKHSLYEGGLNNYDWITSWMDLFKAVNKERRGSKAAVVKRMKDFFANNPQYTVEQVMSATRNYLRGVTNPTYCKTSHKFIKEQDGSSMLLEQLELLTPGRGTYKRYDDTIR